MHVNYVLLVAAQKPTIVIQLTFLTDSWLLYNFKNALLPRAIVLSDQSPIFSVLSSRGIRQFDQHYLTCDKSVKLGGDFIIAIKKHPLCRKDSILELNFLFYKIEFLWMEK